ncbi:DNA polymerase, beta domain protein region [Vulcanisaeta moutnovskia 768-28]|uniref:DNA polymerase, beta domain protein region n=1 Tax=Vulcanisaeta moutnovskia (strain 768-28) TaxID=985053 RepID=F0QSN3_VULM7|nr:nucleotidyltransferase domain-containing protein [Vulcanisaeta moutnovskia]ADY01550.1 DNA polymerase, beta domain protein region [Vulcanisaeta moutnovskia 768-28]
MEFSGEYIYHSMRREERELIISRIRDILREYGISLGILFGSFVELNEFRDIDIAVYGKNLDLNALLSLGTRLEEVLGMPVDVVPLINIDPKFRLSIMEHGLIILEAVDGLYEALIRETLDELYLVMRDDDSIQ